MSTDADAAHLGPSSLHVTPRGPAIELELPFACELADDHITQLSLATSDEWRAYFAPYESVLLLDFRFTVQVFGDNTSSCRFAVTDSHRRPSGAQGWFRAPYYKRFAGGDSNTTQGDWVLPTAHPFGRELKAPPLGNPPPVFHWHFTGSDNGAEVRGIMRVRLTGYAPLRALLLNTEDHKI